MSEAKLIVLYTELRETTGPRLSDTASWPLWPRGRVHSIYGPFFRGALYLLMLGVVRSSTNSGKSGYS